MAKFLILPHVWGTFILQSENSKSYIHYLIRGFRGKEERGSAFPENLGKFMPDYATPNPRNQSLQLHEFLRQFSKVFFFTYFRFRFLNAFTKLRKV